MLADVVTYLGNSSKRLFGPSFIDQGMGLLFQKKPKRRALCGLQLPAGSRSFTQLTWPESTANVLKGSSGRQTIPPYSSVQRPRFALPDQTGNIRVGGTVCW